MDDMSWRQRGLVLLSILAMTLIGLAINKAPAGEQTRFYGPDDGPQVLPRSAAIRRRSMVLMAGGLATQRPQANAADLILLDNDFQSR